MRELAEAPGLSSAYTPQRSQSACLETFMQDEKKYWFPAKRYGWGWGFPTTWQGVLVFVAYAAALAFGTQWLVRDHQSGLFLLYAAALTALLMLVCWLKGEPPRWRSGGGD